MPTIRRIASPYCVAVLNKREMVEELDIRRIDGKKYGDRWEVNEIIRRGKKATRALTHSTKHD